MNVNFSETDINRLETEANIWLATTGNGRPHLIPIWFVLHEGSLFICTLKKSQKAVNITRNNRVSFALQDGDKPLSCEGTAEILDPPHQAEIIDKFITKFDWDIGNSKTYDCIIKISPTKIMFRKA